jgi:hypothetical protein
MVAQVLDQVVADGSWVLDRPGQQVLQGVRGGLAGVLSDRPAVLSWQVGQQPEHQRSGVPSGLHPAKPVCDPAQQRLQRRLPAGGIDLYAVAGGHRLIVGCSHNPMIDGGCSRPLPGPAP